MPWPTFQGVVAQRKTITLLIWQTLSRKTWPWWRCFCVGQWRWWCDATLVVMLFFSLCVSWRFVAWRLESQAFCLGGPIWMVGMCVFFIIPFYYAWFSSQFHVNWWLLVQKKACETQDLGEAKPANKCQYPGAGVPMVKTGICTRKGTLRQLQKYNLCMLAKGESFSSEHGFGGKMVSIFYISNDMSWHYTTWHYYLSIYKQKTAGFHHFPFLWKPKSWCFKWKFLNFTASRLRLRFASMQTVPKSLLYPQPGCLDMANHGGGILWGG